MTDRARPIARIIIFIDAEVALSSAEVPLAEVKDLGHERATWTGSSLALLREARGRR